MADTEEGEGEAEADAEDQAEALTPRRWRLTAASAALVCELVDTPAAQRCRSEM